VLRPDELNNGLPKAFYYDSFYFPFFFVSLCVPLWLRTGGGFRLHHKKDMTKNLQYQVFYLSFESEDQAPS